MFGLTDVCYYHFIFCEKKSQAYSSRGIRTHDLQEHCLISYTLADKGILFGPVQTYKSSRVSLGHQHAGLILHGGNEGKCLLVIALVPFKCSSRNLQFPHRLSFTEEEMPCCPCPFKNEAYCLHVHGVILHNFIKTNQHVYDSPFLNINKIFNLRTACTHAQFMNIICMLVVKTPLLC